MAERKESKGGKVILRSENKQRPSDAQWDFITVNANACLALLATPTHGADDHFLTPKSGGESFAVTF